IDLWADRTADPGALIAEGIGAEIRALDNAAVRLARSVGLKSLGGEYANLDITQIGKPDGTTLTEAIRLLMKRSGRPRSEEHTSELQSLMRISYAVFCLK